MIARLIATEETFSLRSAILRPGRPIDDVYYEGDDDEHSFHVGTFLDDGETQVAIATMLRMDEPRCPASPAYRLRGMAVAADQQRRGMGSAAIKFAEDEVVRRGGVAVWCHAREIAVPFYLTHGYESVGDEYPIPNIGPHYFCFKRLFQKAIEVSPSG